MPPLTTQTWLPRQSSRDIFSQLIKGWSQKGGPPPAAFVSQCWQGRWSLFFFWLSITSPHTDLSPSLVRLSPRASGSTVMLLYFHLPNELLSIDLWRSEPFQCSRYLLQIILTNCQVSQLGHGSWRSACWQGRRIHARETHTRAENLKELEKKETKLLWQLN